MARKPDGKPASTERVSFTRPAAERIGKAVRQVEAGDRDLGPIEWGPRGGGAASKVFRVCTFTGAWSINTAKTVTFRNVTTTPNTASAMNLFAEFTQTTAAVNCAIAKDGTAWYLIAPTGVDRKTAQASVLTSVSLGTAGLEFTRLEIKIFETVSSSVVTIVPADESVVTDVSLGAGGLQFTKRGIKVFATATGSVVTIGTTACT
jgi:hypothetical protein